MVKIYFEIVIILSYFIVAASMSFTRFSLSQSMNIPGNTIINELL